MPTSGAGSGFFQSFANSTYEISLQPNTGTTFQGDNNSTYYSLSYSIYNLQNSWMSSGYCPIELILVGAFPDARYFSIADYDNHYASAQHLADADIDPVGNSQGSYGNPFTPNVHYNGSQEFLVPVSLGYIPTTANAGCAIDPFEQDNLLDATQRHPSMDWNTVPQTSAGVTPPLHGVNEPNNSSPNTAGNIVVRSYLAPPQCTSPTDPTTCGGSSVSEPVPYLIIRDTQTGCAYPASGTSVATLLYNNTNASSAVVSTIGDPTQTPPTSHWLNTTEQAYHVGYTNVTPQACFADGDLGQTTSQTSSSPSFYNAVAWVRSPEWVGQPGPDDAYLAGQISSSELASLAASGGPPNGQAIRMRIKLPSVPDTPCNPTRGSFTCKITGSEQLRYWSLSFVQQQPQKSCTSTTPLAANPDGINLPPGSSCPPTNTIISLADTAFWQDSNGYATLIVGVGEALPTWLTSGTGWSGATEGAFPVTNPNGAFSVVQNSYGYHYTVLDLSQFVNANCAASAVCFNTQYPLQLVLRNTLPNTSTTPFNCSGFAVPFYAEEYTSSDSVGSGLMGPYVPLVDYPTFGSLAKPSDTGPSTLPSAGSCGVLPNSPVLTTGLNLDTPNEVQWPTYWPTGPTQSGFQNLSCTPVPTTPAPSIYFATSQRYSALAPSGCGAIYTLPAVNPCQQIVHQTSQSVPGEPPPLPVTLVGSGFGFLPQHQDTIGGTQYTEMGIPFVPPPGSGLASSSFLRVQDCGAGTTCTESSPSSYLWDTARSPGTAPECQVYIANWSDSLVSLYVNIPVDATNAYLGAGTPLSALNDFSVATIFPAAQNTMNCPVSQGDTLTFTLDNPQGGGQATLTTNQVQ